MDRIKLLFLPRSLSISFSPWRLLLVLLDNISDKRRKKETDRQTDKKHKTIEMNNSEREKQNMSNRLDCSSARGGRGHHQHFGGSIVTRPCKLCVTALLLPSSASSSSLIVDVISGRMTHESDATDSQKSNGHRHALLTLSRPPTESRATLYYRRQS